MAEIRRYVIEIADRGGEGWEYEYLGEAQEAASRLGERCAVIARVYEFSDSELVEVYGPDGHPTGEDVFP